MFSKLNFEGVEVVLNGKQLKAARMLAEGDKTQKEIAEELKITPQTMVRWKQLPEFKEKVAEFLDELLDDQKKELKRLSKKATRTMEKLLDARSEMVRYQAAKDILDRVGLKPEEAQGANNANILINIQGSRSGVDQGNKRGVLSPYGERNSQ